MINKKNVFFGGVIFLIVLEIFLATYSLYSSTNNPYFCSAAGNCSEVQNSAYGKIFGIKVALFGVYGFVLLLIIYVLSIFNKKLRIFCLASAAIGALFAFYFIFVQFFILKRMCLICLIIDFVMIFIFALLVWRYWAYRE